MKGRIDYVNFEPAYHDINAVIINGVEYTEEELIEALKFFHRTPRADGCRATGGGYETYGTLSAAMKVVGEMKFLYPPR